MRSIVAVIALASLVLACSKEESPAGGSKTVSAGGVAADVAGAKAAAGTVNGRCPVLVNELVEKDAPTRTYKDPATGKEQKVGFCCDKCPKDFDKDPAKYMDRMRADPVRFGYTAP